MATDNPPIYLPFGNMTPGIGHIAKPGSNHTLLALNVWPSGHDGYLPAGDLVESGFAQTPIGQPTGSALFSQRFLYYGNLAGEIFAADYALLSVIQRHVAVSSSVDWSLVRFGDAMIATNFEDPVLAQTTRASSFANLITTGPFTPSDGQDETSYDGAPATEGTFVGGTGHAVADVITLSDASTVTVDAEGAGIVTAFTVDSTTSIGSVADGSVLIQVSTTGSGIDFALTLGADNVSGPHLQAKFVEKFGNRIVLANLKTTGSTALGPAGDFPFSIWVSGFQAANNFDVLNLELRSSFLTMPSKYGVITGAVEVGDVLLVFFERGVERVSIGDGLIGTGGLFREMLVEGVGCIHSRSIISYGGAAYFWGPSGPASVGPSGYAELGADELTTTLLSGRWPVAVEIELDRTLDVPGIIGLLSPSTNSLLWRYPPADSQFNDVLLGWNFRTGRFSFPALFRKSAPGTQVPVNGQDETNYDDSPSTEGTFDGGGIPGQPAGAHAVSDVITLSDGTNITVDAVSPIDADIPGAVTQFTVDSTASTGAGVADGSTLIQGPTTGSGVGFSLTLGSANVTGGATIDNTIRLLEDRSDVFNETWEIGSTIALGSFDSTNVTLKRFSTDFQGGEMGDAAFIGGARFQMAFTQILEDSTAAPSHLLLVASPASGSSQLPRLDIALGQKKNPLTGLGDQTTLNVSTVDSPFDPDSGWIGLHHDDETTAAQTSQASRYNQFDITITPSALWRAASIQGIYLRYTSGGSW